MFDVIGLHARLAPERLAARDLTLDLRWNYSELDGLVGRFAAEMQARGIQTGDRVAVLARNSVWLVALHYACARIGAIYVPLNGRLVPAELSALLDRAEPSMFLTDDEAAPAVGGRQPETLASFVAASEQRQPLREGYIDPALASLILFTSGTSGRPKGVMRMDPPRAIR